MWDTAQEIVAQAIIRDPSRWAAGRVSSIDPTVDTRTPAQRSVGFQVPGSITPRGFYNTPRPTAREPQRLHDAVDIAGVEGTPVRAPVAGRIVDVWLDDTTRPFTGYGPAGVLLLGDDGYFHLLGHLSPALDSTLNRRVDVGERVGWTGTPNHVHWEVRTHRTWGAGQSKANVVLDPVSWLVGDVDARPLSAAQTRPPAPPAPPPASSPWALLVVLGLAALALKGNRR